MEREERGLKISRSTQISAALNILGCTLLRAAAAVCWCTVRCRAANASSSVVSRSDLSVIDSLTTARLSSNTL